MAITLPDGFEYAAASLVSVAWVLLYQSSVVGKHRKLSGIKYPQLYAEKAEVEASIAAKKFNCAQRAHHNTLENLPIVLVSTLVSGLQYPVAAASLTAAWAVGRVAYTWAYTSGDPAKRNNVVSIIGSLGHYSNVLLASYAAFSWIYSRHA